MSKSKTKILFVCHGNICRSPMAEFVMKDLMLKRGDTLAPANFDFTEAEATKSKTVTQDNMVTLCKTEMQSGEGGALSESEPDGYDFYIASAATDTDEIGNPIYPPALSKLREHGMGTPENELGVRDERARLMTKADYDAFDYIILMDKENIRHSRRFVKGDPDGKVNMMLDQAGSPRYGVALCKALPVI